MASAASIAGISAHGLRWRYTISLTPFTKVIAEIREDLAGPAEGDRLTLTLNMLYQKIDHFLSLHKHKELKESLRPSDEEALEWLRDINVREELEAVFNNDVDEFLREMDFRLNEIWDFFDYHRILAN